MTRVRSRDPSPFGNVVRASSPNQPARRRAPIDPASRLGSHPRSRRANSPVFERRAGHMRYTVSNEFLFAVQGYVGKARLWFAPEALRQRRRTTRQESWWSTWQLLLLNTCETSCLSAKTAPARHRSPRRCCTSQAVRPAWARPTTGNPISITTRRRSGASSRSARPSPPFPTKTTRSTCLTRRATPISSATRWPPCRRPRWRCSWWMRWRAPRS